MKRTVVHPVVRVLVAVFLLSVLLACRAGAAHVPDKGHLSDRALLDEVQRDAFRYMWEDGEPESGMAYEANFDWEVNPVAVGGTGFGVAAIVAAADRGWITRNQAVARIGRIVRFLLERTDRAELHGAFPHWLNGATGDAVNFDANDTGADIVETSFLMQGLLIARAYFNGPGAEEELRRDITVLWEGVDWNWFTAGEDDGLYWHWTPERGHLGLKVTGYNECLVTYLLALSSPSHPISRRAYDHWTSRDDYQAKTVFGYEVEATASGGGPLFLAHYSFIGLDPRQLADAFVTKGYFVRNVNQTLSNRAYCLQDAPKENRYSPEYWGLTASQIEDGYSVNDPYRDSGTVAPTAALSSMPYTPWYSMQVLRNFGNGLRKKIWGRNGPYDAINIRDGWVSDRYLAIDQMPIVCMIENYRSGLLWRLFMSDPDVKRGLEKAGMALPVLAAGFPEAVVTVRKEGVDYLPEAHDLVRHPDTGKYAIPFWSKFGNEVFFDMQDENGEKVFQCQSSAVKGRNILFFDQFAPPDGKILTLTMTEGDASHRIPVRLN